MKKLELTEDQRSTITHGLYIAAERFDEHVKSLTHEPLRTMPQESERLRFQFQQQAKDARAVMELIEGAETITVVTAEGESN